MVVRKPSGTKGIVFCSFPHRELLNMLPFYKVMVIICCSEEWDISPDSCWLLSALILKTKILQKLGEVMESLETMKQSMFPCKQGMK